MLVMVELVRLLMVYLQEHRVAVDFLVELGIVATLREIVLQGVVPLGANRGPQRFSPGARCSALVR